VWSSKISGPLQEEMKRLAPDSKISVIVHLRGLGPTPVQGHRKRLTSRERKRLLERYGQEVKVFTSQLEEMKQGGMDLTYVPLDALSSVEITSTADVIGELAERDEVLAVVSNQRVLAPPDPDAKMDWNISDALD